MVLASTADVTFIDELANLVDKIMEAATPTLISDVSQSQLSSEMEQLCSQISDLQKLLRRLSTSLQ